MSEEYCSYPVLECKLHNEDEVVKQRDEALNQLDSAKHSVDVLEKRVKQLEAKLLAMKIERDAARQALEHDRVKVIEACNTFSDAFQRRSWILESRGPYEWDDDRYRDEFRQCYDELSKPIDYLIKIGRDWSNCPETQSEVDKARQNPHARAIALEKQLDSTNQSLDELIKILQTEEDRGYCLSPLAKAALRQTGKSNT